MNFFVYIVLIYLIEHSYEKFILTKNKTNGYQNKTIINLDGKTNNKTIYNSTQNEENFSNFNKPKNTNTSIISTCEIQCDKISQIFDCYCDIECKKNNDCCNIYLPECENFFLMKEIEEFKISKTKNTTKLEGTCCDKNKPPINCFCDKKCEQTGDCCPDYKKC